MVGTQASLAAAQRTRRPPTVVTIPKELGAMLQPEPVRSILIIYLGRDLSKSRVNELEAALRKAPDNIDDRFSLIGYYSWKGQTAADRLRWRTHVLWIIQEHPEHPAAAEPSLRDLPDDPDGNAQILEVWYKNLESRGSELGVLKNAEKFFFGKDPAKAEQILHRLSEIEPDNRHWPSELAKLYTMSGIPGYREDDAAKTAFEAYTRVLELTRDPVARETLAGDMAESAFKTGAFAAAVELAKIDLQSSDRSSVQRANTILGRIALRSGDLNSAKQYLLDSSNPAAARHLELFSPTMSLAKELLEKGEREAVLEYLENCLSLSPRSENVLQVWVDDLKSGRVPDFGSFAF
jgi:tetratricopeptide (TPR) repeat protein